MKPADVTFATVKPGTPANVRSLLCMLPNVLRKVSSSTGDQKHPDVVSLNFVYWLDF